MKSLRLFVIILSLISSFNCYATKVNYLISKANANPYSWSGFYAGLNVGTLNNTLSVTDIEYVINGSTINLTTNNNFTSGLQLGYRHQFEKAGMSGILGIEGTLNWANIHYQNKYGATGNIIYKLNKYALLQGIGGITANRALFFLAFGLAYAKINGQWYYDPPTDPLFNFPLERNSIGLAYGIGAEYALTDKISLNIKLDYINLNRYKTHDSAANIFSTHPNFFYYFIENRFLVNRLGLNINFD